MLATPVKQPPPIRLVATPPPRIQNRARSKSDPLGYPPDNWIPPADDQSHIAMPPPHRMSPSPSPVTTEPPVRIPDPVPVPPPPVIDEEATVETSTASETSSETIPPRSAVRMKDYAYHASKLRERDEQPRPRRPRTPTPLSPGSTRMSDYGILSSPQVDMRRGKAPVQAPHFEIERSTTPTREKMNRSWSLRRKKDVRKLQSQFPSAVSCLFVFAERVSFAWRDRRRFCTSASSRYRKCDSCPTAEATRQISIIQNVPIVFIILVDLDYQGFLV